MTGSDSKVEVEVEILNETDKAVLVTVGSRRSGEWLPRSQIEIDAGPFTNVATITLPEWLAIRAGLV